MVKAGVYLIVRLAPPTRAPRSAPPGGGRRPLPIVVTAALANRQSNGKRVLAYSNHHL
jgi:NADH:ubiquinone oxidoreductase subunit 5 (subunit L)/multisubunit Na+/H+ antiporter MnhA subunit